MLNSGFKCVINSYRAGPKPPGVPGGSDGYKFYANRGTCTVFQRSYLSSWACGDKIIHSKVVGNFMLFLTNVILFCLLKEKINNYCFSKPVFIYARKIYTISLLHW